MCEAVTGREVARGKTGVVFTNEATHRVAFIPDAFRQRFNQAVGEARI